MAPLLYSQIGDEAAALEESVGDGSGEIYYPQRRAESGEVVSSSWMSQDEEIGIGGTSLDAETVTVLSTGSAIGTSIAAPMDKGEVTVVDAEVAEGGGAVILPSSACAEGVRLEDTKFYRKSSSGDYTGSAPPLSTASSGGGPKGAQRLPPQDRPKEDGVSGEDRTLLIYSGDNGVGAAGQAAPRLKGDANKVAPSAADYSCEGPVASLDGNDVSCGRGHSDEDVKVLDWEEEEPRSSVSKEGKAGDDHSGIGPRPSSLDDGLLPENGVGSGPVIFEGGELSELSRRKEAVAEGDEDGMGLYGGNFDGSTGTGRGGGYLTEEDGHDHGNEGEEEADMFPSMSEFMASAALHGESEAAGDDTDEYGDEDEATVVVESFRFLGGGAEGKDAGRRPRGEKPRDVRRGTASTGKGPPTEAEAKDAEREDREAHPSKALFDILDRNLDAVPSLALSSFPTSKWSPTPEDVKLCFVAFVATFTPPPNSHIASEYNWASDEVDVGVGEDAADFVAYQNGTAAREGAGASAPSAVAHQDGNGRGCNLHGECSKGKDGSVRPHVPADIVFSLWEEVLFADRGSKIGEGSGDDSDTAGLSLLRKLASRDFVEAALEHIRDSLSELRLLDVRDLGSLGKEPAYYTDAEEFGGRPNSMVPPLLGEEEDGAAAPVSILNWGTNVSAKSLGLMVMQVHQDIHQQYGEYLASDSHWDSYAQTVRENEKRWNKAVAESAKRRREGGNDSGEEKDGEEQQEEEEGRSGSRGSSAAGAGPAAATGTTNDYDDYALRMLPCNMIRAERFDDAAALLQDGTFVRRRLGALGVLAGTTAHVTDVDDLLVCLCERWDEWEAGKWSVDASEFTLRAYELVEEYVSLRATECKERLPAFAVVEPLEVISVASNARRSRLLSGLNEAGKALHLMGASVGAQDHAEREVELHRKALCLKRLAAVGGVESGGNGNGEGGNREKAIEEGGKAWDAEELFDIPFTLSISDTLHCLGYAYDSSGDLKRALECYEWALDMRVELLGEDDLKVAETFHNKVWRRDVSVKYP